MLKLLILVCISFAFSKTQINDDDDLSKLSSMITQKVAVQVSKNLSEMGHSAHFISHTLKEFSKEAPQIIAEELSMMKFELETKESSISKRSIKDWVERRRILKSARSHAQNATYKVKSKLESHNSLSKRQLGTITVAQMLVGAGYAALLLISGVLLVNLVFYFTEICNQFFRYGLWGYGYGYNYPGYVDPGYGYGYPGYGPF